LLSRLDPSARKLLARLPLAAVLAFGLWFLGLSEAWGRAVTAATEATIRAFERPPVTFLTWEGNAVAYRRSDFSSRSDSPGLDPSAVTGNLVLLLALAFAVPGVASARGAVRTSLALAALFVSHVVHVALTVETTYATQLGAWSLYAYRPYQRELIASGRYFFDIALRFALPFVLWGILIVVPFANERDAADAEGEPPKRTRPKKKR
jgi:hypothetical protein